jgi:hypothetical protein
MRTLGTLLLAIGLWYGLAVGLGLFFDPSDMRDPLVQWTAVDGTLFAALGACLLGLGRQKKPVKLTNETRADQGPRRSGMIRKTLLLCGCLLVLATAVLFTANQVGYRFSLTDGVLWAPSNASSVEKHGLIITVNAVRQNGEQVFVDYTMQWVSYDRLCFGHAWWYMHAHFYDSNENKVPGNFSQFNMFRGREGAEFLDYNACRSYKGTAEFTRPKEAAYISIGVDSSLMTNKVALGPARMASSPHR